MSFSICVQCALCTLKHFILTIFFLFYLSAVIFMELNSVWQYLPESNTQLDSIEKKSADSMIQNAKLFFFCIVVMANSICKRKRKLECCKQLNAQQVILKCSNNKIIFLNKSTNTVPRQSFSANAQECRVQQKTFQFDICYFKTHIE